LPPASFSLKGRKRKLLSSGKNLETQQKGISLLSLEIIIKSRGFENSQTSSKAHAKIKKLKKNKLKRQLKTKTNKTTTETKTKYVFR